MVPSLRRAPPALLLLVLLAVPLAGCLSGGGSDEVTPVSGDGGNDTAAGALNFSEPMLIDDLRAGGEPVIAATTEGTLIVSAHPGYTHVHPDAGSPAGLVPAVVPTQGQSYLWRSTDGGETWEHVTLLPAAGDAAPNTGPRGVQGHGVSDPDLSVDPTTGRIWLTDLEALASASVSWSDDDGETWLMGNDLASEGVVDRQWLASHNGTAYFTANYFSPPGRRVLASEDGLDWEEVGQLPGGCGGDFLASPASGHLYAGCGGGVALSTDGGATWTEVEAPVSSSGPIESEPAVDAAGNVYLPGDPGQSDITVGYTTDDGETWGNFSVLDHFPEIAESNGTVLWPWVSAGSEGRVAITFIGGPGESTSTAPGDWYLYAAIVLDATDPKNRTVHAAKLTPEPFHTAAICQSGTACQLTTATSDSGDRRLGDFFETTVDHDGFLHVTYPDTATRPGDAVSHPGYIRQTGGPRLVAPGADLLAGFPTQG